LKQKNGKKKTKNFFYKLKKEKNKRKKFIDQQQKGPQQNWPCHKVVHPFEMRFF